MTLILVVFVLSVFSGANLKTKDTFINVDSNVFLSSPSSPTLLRVEFEKYYYIDDVYEMTIYYGQTNNFSINPENKVDAIIKIKNADTNKEKTLLKIEKFMTAEYFVEQKVVCGIQKDYLFPKNLNFEIPKELITGEFGKLIIFLSAGSVNSEGEIDHVFGSSIILKYEIKKDKIYFLK